MLSGFFRTQTLTSETQSNLAILRSAHRAASASIKSIAITGSVNALTTGSPEEPGGGPLTNKTWLPITQEQAREANNPYISYCSAKKEGELAVWDFVKTEKPSFTVT